MQLHKRLEELYHLHNTCKNLDDPIFYPHKFSDEADIETAAFIASVLSYGNIRQIRSSIEKVGAHLGPKPFRAIIGGKFSASQQKLYHRFYIAEDIVSLLQILRAVFREHGSLLALFLKNFNVHGTMKERLEAFSGELIGYAGKTGASLSSGLKFMFPAPSGGSACKRMNLFLRWMVRKDNVDFGIWKEVPASSLIIPVDTHIARISKGLGFTQRKNVSWQMAEEITAALRKFDMADPVKYDFSLCHMGIEGKEV